MEICCFDISLFFISPFLFNPYIIDKKKIRFEMEK